jgi:hypothetical protein
MCRLPYRRERRPLLARTSGAWSVLKQPSPAGSAAAQAEQLDGQDEGDQDVNEQRKVCLHVSPPFYRAIMPDHLTARRCLDRRFAGRSEGWPRGTR